jgi:hypothetical protein
MRWETNGTAAGAAGCCILPLSLEKRRKKCRRLVCWMREMNGTTLGCCILPVSAEKRRKISGSADLARRCGWPWRQDSGSREVAGCFTGFWRVRLPAKAALRLCRDVDDDA